MTPADATAREGAAGARAASTPHPQPGRKGTADAALRPRAHDIDEIVAHLDCADRQSLPDDDQIIMGHLRAALVLALSLQRQLRT